MTTYKIEKGVDLGLRCWNVIEYRDGVYNRQVAFFKKRDEARDYLRNFKAASAPVTP